MRKNFYSKSLLPSASIAMMAISLMTVLGEDAVSTNSATDSPKPAATSAVGTVATPVLTAGANDVLKLARAKVGDSTINAFINNSGINYNLSANEIVYLREQGLSDQIITTMLEQRTKSNGDTVAATQKTDASTSQPQAYSLPTTTVIQTAPSPVYVYRDYPVYPVYDDWWYPSVSFDLVYGGGWYGGGFRDRDDHWHGGGSRGGGDGDHGSRGGGAWGGGDGGSRGGGSMGGSHGGSGGSRGGGSGSMGGSRGGSSGGGGSRGGSRH